MKFFRLEELRCEEIPARQNAGEIKTDYFPKVAVHGAVPKMEVYEAAASWARRSLVAWRAVSRPAHHS